MHRRHDNALARILGLSAVLLLAPCSAGADPINLLSNGFFDTVGPSGPSVAFTGQYFFDDAYNPARFVGGPSAAANWGIWNNTLATTTTTLVPSTLPGGGPTMVHVVTTGTNNGLLQSFLPYGTGTQQTDGSVAVYVNNGRVGIGTGNGLYTNFDGFSTGVGAWEFPSAHNGASPANEFLIYSTGGPADFYVGAATVSPVPEPGTLLLLATGIGIPLWMSRARRRFTAWSNGL